MTKKLVDEGIQILARTTAILDIYMEGGVNMTEHKHRYICITCDTDRLEDKCQGKGIPCEGCKAEDRENMMAYVGRVEVDTCEK